MPYQDESKDNDPMMPELQEKTPGVYVRTNEPNPNDLDMLWSSTRWHQKDERSPILFLIGGFLLGVLLTTAVFLLVIKAPDVSTGGTNLLDPIGENLPFMNGDKAAEGDKGQPAQGGEATTKDGAAVKAKFESHVVQSGDTLGSIAQKYYGDSSPAMVEKIARANKMGDTDSLQIDQTLVIPPKNY